MGCFSSKYEPVRTLSPKPLKIRKSRSIKHTMERELQAEPRTFLDIDIAPMVVDDRVIVSLRPQNILLEFAFHGSSGSMIYELVDVHHSGEYQEYSEIISFQILGPLIIHSKIDDSEALIHFTSGDDFHMRILATQKNKTWMIIRGKLQLNGFLIQERGWNLHIINQKDWSTEY
jgi:hypothetical protein